MGWLFVCLAAYWLISVATDLSRIAKAQERIASMMEGKDSKRQ